MPIKNIRSLTLFFDKVEDLKKRFALSEQDFNELKSTAFTDLDSYFLDVADKHGIDLMCWDEYEDEL